jgi:hypothetical protein
MLTVSAPSRTGRRIGFVFDLDADVPWGDSLLMYLIILIMEERSMSNASWSDYSAVARLSSAQLVLIDVAEFAFLIFLLLCRAYGWLWIDRLPAVIGGVMPLVVPWAGALGGLSISIVGVSRNFRKWGPKISQGQSNGVMPILRSRSSGA